MKNTFFFAALLLGAAANGQTPDSTKQLPAIPATTVTTMADTSINAAYIADREALKNLTTETLRPEHAFPVLGSYTASGTSTGAVTITLDSANKGIVWVDGLAQGRFKALMKKAPSTYKIPAQKTESGKSISEGTLFLNPTSKELTIVLGRPFNDADPSAAFAGTGKKKTTTWQYTGIKNGTAAAPATTQQ